MNPPKPNFNTTNKQSPDGKSQNKRHKTAADDYSPAKNNHLIMGQVRILKRGEELSPWKKKKKKAVGDLEGLGRLGPEPEMVPISNFYAGSTVIESPPPSSLPLPVFLDKKFGTLPAFFLE